MSKKIFLSLISLLICMPYAVAQTECPIPMMITTIGQTEDIPESAQGSLKAKLRQAVLQCGIEGGEDFACFALVASATENSKEVISGNRPLITLTVDLELFVGNNYTNEKFASTSITLSGAGRNEAKAFAAAFSKIGADNAKLKEFLTDAKRKIGNYYATQIPSIVKKAEAFVTRREYEEALCLLSSVPVCCNGYNKIENCMEMIFQEYVDYDCAVKVAKASAAWNASQDKAGATVAGAYLMTIDPSSSCRSDALALAEQIRQRIGDDWEFYKELKREEVATEKLQIAAMKAIGVAYGNNQKAQTVNEHWIVR